MDCPWHGYRIHKHHDLHHRLLGNLDSRSCFGGILRLSPNLHSLLHEILLPNWHSFPDQIHNHMDCHWVLSCQNMHCSLLDRIHSSLESDHLRHTIPLPIHRILQNSLATDFHIHCLQHSCEFCGHHSMGHLIDLLVDLSNNLIHSYFGNLLLEQYASRLPNRHVQLDDLTNYMDYRQCLDHVDMIYIHSQRPYRHMLVPIFANQYTIQLFLRWHHIRLPSNHLPIHNFLQYLLGMDCRQMIFHLCDWYIQTSMPACVYHHDLQMLHLHSMNHHQLHAILAPNCHIEKQCHHMVHMDFRDT